MMIVGPMNKGRPCLGVFSAKVSTAALAFALVLFAFQVRAFSLLGPYADWMDVTNAFRQPGDIGGPMDIKEGYRWNVPTVTYGFDESFLNFFGSNGVFAVEAAIQILNDLPPASALVLTNFPYVFTRENPTAAALSLYDLKSATLWVLIEQLGLAQPNRHMFCLKQWDPILWDFIEPWVGPPWPLGIFPDYIIQRNFDPQTLSATNIANGIDYGSYVAIYEFGKDGIPSSADVVEMPVDPLNFWQTAVADTSYANLYGMGGKYYKGLTYDDVAGLKFLLSTNNLNVETLLPNIHAATTGSTLVNAALRPGVDKITFIPHPFDTALCTFLQTTNHFTDTFITNGQVSQQKVERVINQPDFLFCAGDNGRDGSQTTSIVRTGTTNWINNAALNGGMTQFGPGVIAPPVRIVFHQAGPWVISDEPSPETNAMIMAQQWGSFDGSTNLPISFPSVGSETGHTLGFRLRICQPYHSDVPLASYTWQLPVGVGGVAILQTSTNISDWLPVIAVTNNGTIIEWFHFGVSQEKRFFRVVPQTGTN
jgi:hypothetical protein